jgi:hypothetical protein
LWTVAYLPDEIYDDFLEPVPALVVNTYTSTTTGEKRHLLQVNDNVLNWLKEEHDQYGIKNPEWYWVNNRVNISDRLLLVLKLKWM